MLAAPENPTRKPTGGGVINSGRLAVGHPQWRDPFHGGGDEAGDHGDLSCWVWLGCYRSELWPVDEHDVGVVAGDGQIHGEMQSPRVTGAPLYPGLAHQYAVHAAVRGDAGRLTAALAPSQQTRSPEGIAAYWGAFAAQLHHHHEIEDTFVWPLLRQRVGSEWHGLCVAP